MNFAELKIARINLNTGKFVKNSVLIYTEKITSQNVCCHLLYLISYLLFRGKGVLIFKGGLSGVRYQTPKIWSESCETKFISVRPKYLWDRAKIYIFRNSSPRAILRNFFRVFVFLLMHGPVENY